MTDARKIILDSVKEEGARILGAIFNDGTDSVYKKIFGNAAFKKIAKEYRSAEIGKIVRSVKGKNISDALTQYESLNNVYNNLVAEINSKNYSAANIKVWADSFTSIAKKIQSSLSSLGVTVNLENLPSPALALIYNAGKTEVTVTTGYGAELEPSDYNSKVKKIDASTKQSAIFIRGNDNDNVIYGGGGSDTLRGGKGKDKLYGNAGADKLYGEASNDSLSGGGGNDTLYGGKGNDYLAGDAGDDILYGEAGTDTLSGGAGNDTFYYASGDGDDLITDYSSEDEIYLTSGSIDSVTLNGKDVIFKIGAGSIKLQNAKDKKITVVSVDPVFEMTLTEKYLNGELISRSVEDTSEVIIGYPPVYYNGAQVQVPAVTNSDGAYSLTMTEAGEFLISDLEAGAVVADRFTFTNAGGAVLFNADGGIYGIYGYVGDLILNQADSGLSINGDTLTYTLGSNTTSITATVDIAGVTAVSTLADGDSVHSSNSATVFNFTTDNTDGNTLDIFTVNDKIYTVCNDNDGIAITAGGVVTGLDQDASLRVSAGSVIINGIPYSAEEIATANNTGEEIIGFEKKNGEDSSFLTDSNYVTKSFDLIGEWESGGDLDSLMNELPIAVADIPIDGTDNPNKILTGVAFAYSADKK